MDRKASQGGFTLIELMFVITILGILAAIAIPKFSGVATAANTAKIQADLRTIDTAIMIHYATQKSMLAATIATQLDTYISSLPKPPTGAARLADNTAIKIAAGAQYTIAGTEAGEQYAQVLTDQGEKKLADFVK